jgi:transglutaminase-like putative cysteine protease
MYYSVTHLTIYKYNEPITDSVMELRLHPRNEGNQRVVRFDLGIRPMVKAFSHRDYLHNMIHTFNIPSSHDRLAIKAETIVEIKPSNPLPMALDESAWERIDLKTQERDYYDMLLPGRYTHSTPLLEAFSQEIGWGRRSDPLTLLRELNTTIYNAFDYQQHVTRVDSPIDVALEARRGVCQDFTHIMLLLVRQVGIPARYVSGYLYHRHDASTHDRSDEDASHAWVEAWLPDLGWVGFDPTNDILVSDRHVRVSVANDYAGASPSRGVFKGSADTELEVRVQVKQLEELPEEHKTLTPELPLPQYDYQQQQQQQQ